MRPRLLPVLATGVLTLSLLGPVTAVADDREVTGPSLPAQASDTARERAEAALSRAQALFAEKSPAAAKRRDSGAEPTIVLNQLVRARPHLSPADRERADVLLARPTAPGGDGIADYSVPEAKPHCGGAICVHYVRRTADAPPRADSDGDGVPDAVEQTLGIARHVHGTYVDSGYRRPDSDGRRGGRRGKVDIYLADLGDRGFYGYCTTDPKETGSHVAAYCAIDDDFARSQFEANTPTQNRKVTLAHEYFHAVQFAYDFYEDPWFMEATATWAEDEVYDAIDDNRQFLYAGQLETPRVPLDLFDPNGLNHYGNWIFFRHLTERRPAEIGSLPNLVLDMWEHASARRGAPDMYSTQAIDAVLTARGSSFTSAYGDFAVDNRDPEPPRYDEGAAYAKYVADPVRSHVLSSTATTVEDGVRIDHLASAPVRFLPGSDLGTRPRTVQLTVDMPASETAPVARIVVHRTDGTSTASQIALSDDGVGSAVVDFTRGQVSDVELVLANASLVTRCGGRTAFACQGNPRDDDLATRYRATVQN